MKNRNPNAPYVLVLVVIAMLILLLSGCANTVPYIKIGGGLILNQPKITWTNSKTGNKNVSDDPISARIEAGAHVGGLSYGVSHHSQWFTGAPFNDDLEYSKTELFVDYEWTF